MVVAALPTWLCFISFLVVDCFLVSYFGGVADQDTDFEVRWTRTLYMVASILPRLDIWRVQHGCCLDGGQLDMGSAGPIFPLALNQIASYSETDIVKTIMWPLGSAIGAPSAKFPVGIPRPSTDYLSVSVLSASWCVRGCISIGLRMKPIPAPLVTVPCHVETSIGTYSGRILVNIG